MSLLKLCQSSTKTIVFKCTESQGLYISARKLSIVPSIYDGENPAPKFFSSGVQIILKRLTRPNFEKVFRKRTNSNISVLRTPVYKFLTDEELKIEQSNAYKSAERLLQMPPVVKVQEPVDDILSKDPALVGYDSSTYLFTDITYGVANEHRLIIQREPDGTLRSCDHDVRKKLNQGRKLRDPLVFSDPEKFNSLLDRQKYEYILDRACVQYEPDDPQYQKLTSITYQHVDMNNQYNLIRSTRHFGPLAFYLTWHDSIDNLMLEMVQTGIIREAVLLMSLRQAIKEDLVNGEESTALVSEILPTRIQLRKPDYVSEDDIQLDTKCMECLDKYINNNSAMKSQQGLALQGFREYYQQLIEISRGLQKAHGSA
ncbi:small ribosomal subunit protein mS22 isoform X2 [Danaus plexippus]|uniref:small ribosomal subunit protein mS22 isoform X2 n=1 Tax=Danaus plexippus TaxID=13037 RepID=UPI002AB2156B|nr:small ribosomal subunit protein mS22 isoform X2 [Danaus plexippus]